MGRTGFSENSDVTHSNPIYFPSFKNANVIKIDIEGKDIAKTVILLTQNLSGSILFSM